MVWKIKNDPGQIEKSHMGKLSHSFQSGQVWRIFCDILRPAVDEFGGGPCSPRGSASCLLERPAGFLSVALSAEVGLYLGNPGQGVYG